MESILAKALGLEYSPVALIWADHEPEKAIEFAPGKWGCIMFHVVQAAKGRVTVMSRETFGCPGGGVGLGFGNRYEEFPGGPECFYRFLSAGNREDPAGAAIGSAMRQSGNEEAADDFLNGECYVQDPTAAKRFVEAMPIQDIPAQYVVFKPLTDTDLNQEDVHGITLLVTPDQLSALVVLANYAHPERENISVPFAAGCQILGVFTYREEQAENPRALIGMTDLSARKNTQRVLGKSLMSFTMTRGLFLEMESRVPGSFLERPTWAALKPSAGRDS